MALRSAVPFHNQWPNQNAFTDLPNSAGAPIQSSALQVGDICYDESALIYYYCTDATLGAAVWVQLGGASSPAPDHQARYFIVGNALSGDTISVCDILDTGDGAGIAAALTASALVTPPRDVYVRPGIYTLTAQLSVPEGVRLLGAGRGRTRIVGFVDAPSILVSPRGTEVCDVDITLSSTLGALQTGGAITLGFLGTTVIPETPFALRRLNIEFTAAFSANPAGPLSGLFLGGGDTDYVSAGNAIEDVYVYASTAFPCLSGTNIADRTAGLRATLTPVGSPAQDVGVNISNLCVQDLEACSILDGVQGFHRACQYEGLGMSLWSPLPGQQVGFYALGVASRSTYDGCEARIDIPTSVGLQLVGVDDAVPDFFAVNSCATYYDPSNAGAGGLGFWLSTPGINDRLDGVRLYVNFVETAATGYLCETAVSNTVAIGNGTISCATPVSDLGSFNDFGHLQAN